MMNQAIQVIHEASKKISLGLNIPGSLARKEAEWLLLHSLRKEGFDYGFSQFCDPSCSVSDSVARSTFELAQERAEGKLFSHVIGTQVFLDHEYDVGPGVLTPRPETELLVEHCSDFLRRHQLQGRETLQGIEIGLGSGAISFELLSRFENLNIIASEVSTSAYEFASKNYKKIFGMRMGESQRFQCVLAKNSTRVFDDFQVKEKSIHLIVSNPPYLGSKDEVEDRVLDQEPHEALFCPNQDPLFYYRGIAKRAREFLAPNGQVMLELAHQRADAVAQLFYQEGWKVEIHPDLSGLARFLFAFEKGR